jgi:hypothetical protein
VIEPKDRRFILEPKIEPLKIITTYETESKNSAFGIHGSSGEEKENLSLSLSMVGWFKLIGYDNIVFKL